MNETTKKNEDLNIEQWSIIKTRGAIARTGHVYRSPDGTEYLRTGHPALLPDEAAFAKKAYLQGFPVPRVTREGNLPNGMPYFAEEAAGEKTFAQKLSEDFVAQEGARAAVSAGAVSDEAFLLYSEMLLRFLAAQLVSANRPLGGSTIRTGIQLANVLEENPDIAPALLEEAVTKVEERTKHLPLVFSHGDLTPFNVLEKGIIDFEQRLVAPFGYDAVTAVTFQRLWDHPGPDGTGTLKRFEFSRAQIAGYMARVDSLCATQGAPALSPYFDDFLMLKAIWALCYERDEASVKLPFSRWLWRKRVALYCATSYLRGVPIESERFRIIGLTG